MLEKANTKPEEDPHGRLAERPSEIPALGLWDVIVRVYSEVVADRVTLIAAGATYFIVLALFPGMGVLVSIYGFMSDPSDIGEQMGFVSSFLPPGAFDLLLPQLQALSSKGRSELSFAFGLSLLLAFWSATSGVKALFDAMNIAYAEVEKRSLVRLNLMAFGFTLGAIIVLVLLLAIIGVIPLILKALYLDQWAELLARVARWPFVLLLSGCATMVIYRYGPSRENAKLRWITWGAAFSTLTWAVTTVAFSVYLLNFANYNATYGTLGALVAFMIWIWLSIVILIVGAELNAELEHQTKCDSTTGPPRPMGERGAVMADTLGEEAG
ncbi:YihY/virulence factor BrkB family protein (plasmid) [Rhizobium sp. TH2]|uniref:YihY/virulence factor BrkB family protein n=1 Tax=Rhizobium sp. TH2 TaxID=2775403 RepID=UPI002157B997|nr:YihY/virulence factor BrkB family protein [Rhizobium sp. TH2]UVC12373.1 YihY/virulence factor BrkB family protein [Rhizobium sp. TH2]